MFGNDINLVFQQAVIIYVKNSVLRLNKKVYTPSGREHGRVFKHHTQINKLNLKTVLTTKRFIFKLAWSVIYVFFSDKPSFFSYIKTEIHLTCDKDTMR